MGGLSQTSQDGNQQQKSDNEDQSLAMAPEADIKDHIRKY